MIHVETSKEGIGSVEIKGSTAKVMAEFTGTTHALRGKFKEKYGERAARVILEMAFNLAFDDEKMNEMTIPDEGFDGGAQ